MLKSFYIRGGHWSLAYDDGSKRTTEEAPITDFECIGESDIYFDIDEVCSSDPFVLDFPNEHFYEAWWDFGNGPCPIRINQKWGFVNSDFEIVIKPQFDSLGEIQEKECTCKHRMIFTHVFSWNNGVGKVIQNEKEIMITTWGDTLSYYDAKIKLTDNLTIDDIVRISKEFIPPQYFNCPWEYPRLNYSTEEQCCAYMAVYGPMSRHKLLRALDENEFPYRELNSGVEIYDWGCGQGLGAVAVIEKFRQYGLLSKLKKVTLEEPSNIARRRAVLHVRQALGGQNTEITDVPYYLPSDYGDNSNSITEIDVHEPCAIHIFSNVLDIEAISLKGVSRMITSSGAQHIVLCIGPANLSESRIKTFSNYFKKEGLRVFTEFRDTNFGRLSNGRAYGCLIKSFIYSPTNMSYIGDIHRIDNLTINDIVNVSLRYVPEPFKSCPWAYRDSEGRTLEHGTAVLETEEQCCAYMAAYGPMHRNKLIRALDEKEFPYKALNNGAEIYDWGCGQGIGTIAIIEKLRQYGLLSRLKKITLEEPSNVARRRAVLHVRQALGGQNTEIADVPYYLPSDYGDNSNSITEIDVHEPCAIHIFSNILDIEKVSLKGVSKMITSSGTRHIALCIGPANLNESRIKTFSNYFKKEGLRVFTEFRDTNFGHHSNGRAYGCLIKSFTYNLTHNSDILHKYSYFAPVQLFAAYSDVNLQGALLQSAFEILAPFDMTAHKNLCPVYALVSNLISRGCPTLASQKILDAICSKDKAKSLNAVARIQKTFIEAMISDRLDLKKDTLDILVIEDDTSVAKIAISDFLELYHHIVAMTQDYSDMTLPPINIYSKREAKAQTTYDVVIDVSIDQICNPEEVVFSKYKANNDCYFIVRSSKSVYVERFLYTTERIKYKPLVERDTQGNYYNIEETCGHLRYFLNLIFRKEDFRPGQLPILSRALQLKSVIGLLPTGGGKSLTYQLAAMLQPGVTLVVDPLRGLMKDQYDGLLRTGIDCISYINSDITKDREERERRESALTGSQIQIMFLSPERLSIHRFREVLRSMRESDVFFAYGVIDEVHCVSEWGHDFRLAYLHLGRNLFNYVLPKKVEGEDNHISLFGLTATASFDVLADVERELSGSNSYSLEDDATVRYENTNRLELQYYVYHIDTSTAATTWDVGEIKEETLLNVINDSTEKLREIQEEGNVVGIKKRFLERENISSNQKIVEIDSSNLSIEVNNEWYLNYITDAAGIVFCPRAGKGEKKEKKTLVTLSVPSVVNVLTRQGISLISTYKGGDDTRCQDDFLRNGTKLMVATKAFGMGIDKSNVRFTIHLNHPSSLESFVQEAGRAGRDGKMALATIMYADKQFYNQNIRTRLMEWHSADYEVNKFFYDANFLGEDFELFVMQMLLSCLPMRITNEEFGGIEHEISGNSQGILQALQKCIQKHPDKRLTYYISYHEEEQLLNHYNLQLQERFLPIFETPSIRRNRNANKYGYGYAQYKDAIQKAIYRMCVIGLIDDFTEDYRNEKFRIVTVCQEESRYYDYLRYYYRKYYSEDRVEVMINEVKPMAINDGVIMACLKHLTSFIYRSIADKRARGILDMEQFCNMAINSGKDWKETNEDLKDFIYYYFNSKYAREGFVTYDSSVCQEIPFSLKDDTNYDIHNESEITDFNLVRKYMRVVDPEIVNNDSQKDNVKHLQGAVRLIRRAIAEMNPVLNLLNIFCILFLGQHGNELLEEELFNDYEAVMNYFSKQGSLIILDEYTNLLISHAAIDELRKDYLQKLKDYIYLRNHLNRVNQITTKYIEI